MGHARAIAFEGSAGRWVAASWACCGPGAVPAGGEWRCAVGVYRFHGGGGAICSGVGWARGRLLAGSGCRGLTVGGSSAVSPWCVRWWSLVGWLKGVFGLYRIHGGTILCWGAAAVGAAGCGGGACVGVVRVVGGGVSCVPYSAAPHGGLLWWCLGCGLGLGGSWEGAGHAGSGWLGGGGGGACVGLRVCLLLFPRSLPLPFPCSSLFAGLFGFVFFFWGGWLGCCAWVWLCAGAGAGVGVGVVGDGAGWLLRSGSPVCAPAPRLPVSRAPVRGVLTAGGWRQWLRGACVGGRGSWVVPGWRGRAWACVWVCSWRGLMGWWAVWAWLVCVGVGYVCAEGAVGWAGALWAMQWVEEMLVTPTGALL